MRNCSLLFLMKFLFLVVVVVFLESVLVIRLVNIVCLRFCIYCFFLFEC